MTELLRVVYELVKVLVVPFEILFMAMISRWPIAAWLAEYAFEGDRRKTRRFSTIPIIFLIIRSSEFLKSSIKMKEESSLSKETEEISSL